jgi:hypothetical protein
MHALDLFNERQKNIRKALERIIEKVDAISPSASGVVSAIQAYVKLNGAAPSDGQEGEKESEVTETNLLQ